MYYPYSENKGADQLRGYREADLRLCFRLGKTPVFSRCGSYYFSAGEGVSQKHPDNPMVDLFYGQYRADGINEGEYFMYRFIMCIRRNILRSERYC